MTFQGYSVVAPYECVTDKVNVWERYSNGITPQINGRVSSLTVCQKKPYKFAVPSGHKKIYMYKCDGDKLYRKLSGFGTRVSCCEFRGDGKLIAVGEEGGVLRICTTDKNGYHLRKIDAHKGSVNAVSFFADQQRTASVGSDGVVRIWDVTLGSKLIQLSLSNSKESAKALVVGHKDPNLLCAGNFAGDVCIYDIRQQKPVNTFKLPDAISAMALNSIDQQLVIATSCFVHVLDLPSASFLPLSSDSSLTREDGHGLRLHYKLITELCIVQHPDPRQDEVLLSVSLDKTLKVTHLTDFSNLHQMRCLLPLSAVAATPNCETIVIGGEKGFVKIRHLSPHDQQALEAGKHVVGKSKQPPDVEEEVDPLERLASAFSGRWRGGDRSIAMTTDEWLSQPFDGPRRGPKDWVDTGRPNGSAISEVPLIHETSEISRDGRRFYFDNEDRQPFTRIDRFLTRFSHTQALTAVMRPRLLASKSRQPAFANMRTQLLLAVGVIRELVRRNTLEAAVAGRDGRQLSRLLQFVRRNVWRNDCATACLELYNCILNIYAADELVRLPEFFKTNSVLRRLSNNMHSVASCAEFIRHNLAYCESPPVPVPERQNDLAHLKASSNSDQNPKRVPKVRGETIRSHPRKSAVFRKKRLHSESTLPELSPNPVKPSRPSKKLRSL
ncbi:WD domain G-beta repeat protein [Paragonimus heterotremus]|uniref:U3 small nucleolar RNA-associated protein 15 homolog n=1 Tax=Paragonimus heterotremus TaxID=100268 RepID=A0A8J4SVI3_9TREM|nr:WD domain G-beta repeat protein [Paragonimus heterotremus]